MFEIGAKGTVRDVQADGKRERESLTYFTEPGASGFGRGSISWPGRPPLASGESRINCSVSVVGAIVGVELLL
jgi:hypothetical protein